MYALKGKPLWYMILEIHWWTHSVLCSMKSMTRRLVINMTKVWGVMMRQIIIIFMLPWWAYGLAGGKWGKKESMNYVVKRLLVVGAPPRYRSMSHVSWHWTHHWVQQQIALSDVLSFYFLHFTYIIYTTPEKDIWNTS